MKNLNEITVTNIVETTCTVDEINKMVVNVFKNYELDYPEWKEFLMLGDYPSSYDNNMSVILPEEFDEDGDYVVKVQSNITDYDEVVTLLDGNFEDFRCRLFDAIDACESANDEVNPLDFLEAVMAKCEETIEGFDYNLIEYSSEIASSAYFWTEELEKVIDCENPDNCPTIYIERDYSDEYGWGYAVGVGIGFPDFAFTEDVDKVTEMIKKSIDSLLQVA